MTSLIILDVSLVEEYYLFQGHLIIIRLNIHRITFLKYFYYFIYLCKGYDK